METLLLMVGVFVYSMMCTVLGYLLGMQVEKDKHKGSNTSAEYALADLAADMRRGFITGSLDGARHSLEIAESVVARLQGGEE